MDFKTFTSKEINEMRQEIQKCIDASNQNVYVKNKLKEILTKIEK